MNEEKPEVPYCPLGWLERIEQNQKSNKCMVEGCENDLGWKLTYCKSCTEKRKRYFKRKYYENMGWDTSKL